jgi:hypothetical protein
VCYIVSQSDKEGLGGIIFWLQVDAVLRVVLLEVEQAACKKSLLTWACRLIHSSPYI